MLDLRVDLLERWIEKPSDFEGSNHPLPTRWMKTRNSMRLTKSPSIGGEGLSEMNSRNGKACPVLPLHIECLELSS